MYPCTLLPVGHLNGEGWFSVFHFAGGHHISVSVSVCTLELRSYTTYSLRCASAIITCHVVWWGDDICIAFHTSAVMGEVTDHLTG